MTKEFSTACIRKKLKQLVPNDCGVAVTPVKDCFTQLPAEEQAGLNGAARIRRDEFSSGRTAAREALRAAGLPEAVILRGKDGAPRWPEKVVGSITHNRMFAAAVVARVENLHSIGIDIEIASAVTGDLWPQILSPAETCCVLLDTDPVRLATAIFSIKEAFYKFQYPITGVWLDFLDVEVVLALNQVVAFRSSSPAFALLPRFHGVYTYFGDLVLSSVYSVGSGLSWSRPAERIGAGESGSNRSTSGPCHTDLLHLGQG